MIAELMPDPGLVGIAVYALAAGVFVGGFQLLNRTDSNGK